MPKSCDTFDTFAWLSPLSTHSTAFTLSLTLHTFRLWPDMMLCYSTNACCSGRAVVHGTACYRCHPAIDIRFQQQHSQHSIGLLHWTTAHSQCACLPCSWACLSVSMHRLLCVVLGCYHQLCAPYCWTECTSAESTNVKLGLPEKSGSMTSTAL